MRLNNECNLIVYFFLKGYLDLVTSLYSEMTKPGKLYQKGFLEHRWTSPHRQTVENWFQYEQSAQNLLGREDSTFRWTG